MARVSKATAPKYPPLGPTDRAIQSALLDAVETIRDESVRFEIQDLLERGRIDEALDRVRFDLGEAFLRSALPVQYRDLFELSGQTATDDLNRNFGLKMSFNIVSPEAVEFARTRAGELIKDWGTSSKEALRELVTRSVRDGVAPAKLARQVLESGIGLTTRDAIAVENMRRGMENDENLSLTDEQIDARVNRYSDRLLRTRSENIARTEVIRASREGQQEAWRQADEEGLIDATAMSQRWVSTEDERECDICDDLDGETVPLGDNFPGEGGDGPPAHPSCVPGDTMVSPVGRVAAYSERWYDGDLVVITTAEGNRLSCTPNHPILTPFGWVGAGLLQIGGYVISRTACQGIRLGDSDHEDVPTTIKEIADSLRSSGQVLTAEVEVSAPDFHGDGAGSKVAVIGSNRALGKDVSNATISEHGLKVELGGGAHGPVSLSSQGPNAQLFEPSLSAPSGGMSGLPLESPFFGGHPGPFDRFGFGGAAYRTAGLDQVPIDGGAADSDCLRDGEHAISGIVKADEIVDVARIQFSGHVFNLQTEGEIYYAENILTHNCRCTLILVEDK